LHSFDPRCAFALHCKHYSALRPLGARRAVLQFPAARQLLQVLLQRLSLAITCMAPIDGIAGVVGALIKRLDCREVGLVRFQ
jgi:hypothetical protein